MIRKEANIRKISDETDDIFMFSDLGCIPGYADEKHRKSNFLAVWVPGDRDLSDGETAVE